VDQIQNQFLELPKIDKLLKVNEVARLLNISRSGAYNLMQTGMIPTVHIGKSRRVRPRDLEAYIEHNIYASENDNY
jgi:excisionase family DNA binding protein